MSRPYLEVTYRKGQPFAAYLYLSRQSSDRSARVEVVDEVFNVDYSQDDRPIGIEIVHPRKVNLATLNALLAKLEVAAIPDADFAPLAAAA